MKNWNTPAVESLDLNKTEHGWTGIYRDGGYIGDGMISGHLTWDKPSTTPTTPTTPTNPTEPVNPNALSS